MSEFVWFFFSLTALETKSDLLMSCGQTPHVYIRLCFCFFLVQSCDRRNTIANHMEGFLFLNRMYLLTASLLIMKNALYLCLRTRRAQLLSLFFFNNKMKLLNTNGNNLT